MSDEECANIEEVSQSIAYNAILVVKIIICLGGAAFLLRQWIFHFAIFWGVRFLGHANSRVLFLFYYGMFFVLGFNMGSLYLLDFVRLRYECVILDFRMVVILRGLCVSSVLAAHLILIVMSLERLYSSLYPANYEKTSFQCLTAIIAVIMVMLSISYVIWNLTAGFQLFYAHDISMVDIKVPQNALKYVETMATVSLTNVFSMAIFLLDIYLNFYRKRPKDMSLGVSYQFAENRRVIMVLMPIEVIDFVLTISSTVAQILYSKFAPVASPLSRQLFVESTTFIAIYPLILALIIEWKVGRLKRSTVPDETSIDHFENLQKFWA